MRFSALKTEQTYLRFKFIKFMITKRRTILVTDFDLESLTSRNTRST